MVGGREAKKQFRSTREDVNEILMMLGKTMGEGVQME
jgi:cell fate (sporulation/competence/biofilm development) regulator YmcA (YheA/YmcA/DUF963 family)